VIHTYKVDYLTTIDKGDKMTLQKEIFDWLHSRSNWQQETALKILKSGDLSDQDIVELADRSKTAEGQKQSDSRIFPGISSSTDSELKLRLQSIGNIKGIDQLTTKKPLEFRDGNLMVVYGNNGSGKSGYTRILKKICGKSHAVDLKANVFGEKPTEQCCTISYDLNGTKNDRIWNASDEPLDDLSSVDIFDSTCGAFYLEEENEVSYRPNILSLFDKIIKACDKVATKLKLERNNLPSKLPALPSEYEMTAAARKYNSLMPQQTEASLVDILTWEKDDQKSLDILEERLKKADPKKLATQKRKQKSQIETISQELSTTLVKLSASECARIYKLKLKAKNARKTALDGAKIIQNDAPINGVGTESWRALWEAARKFSVEEAYPENGFPNTTEDARCVLCQQELKPEAKDRLLSFEKYVTGTLAVAATEAEQKYDEAIKTLPTIPTKENIETSVVAAGLDQELWQERITQFWTSVKETNNDFKKDSESALNGLRKEDYSWLDELNDKGTDLGNEIDQHESDAESFDWGETNKQAKELLTKKWTASQATAIKDELIRLKEVTDYDSWIANANTSAISKKSGVIAEKLITGAYIDRFNYELKNLGAHRIKVNLAKTRSPKGHALHTIVLNGLTHKEQSPGVVLSAGEKRIVSLAAFLADVTGRAENGPFIFDDPISSLDQDYEEKCIERLIQLSSDRQVIVFTHRLSFLGILENKASPEVVCIRHEPWGVGEPGEVPIYGKAPDKALKNLKNDRLAKATKVQNTEGSEAYYPLAKAICSDFRIIIERIVEYVFLADVIQRHRRQVNTQGKIKKLLRIQESDCDMIDNLMGKYSCYEHSQSSEAPVDVLEPDELRKDIEALLEWHEKFESRNVK